MAEKLFKLTFDGYWLEANKGSIPKKSGVYCVYECTYNKDKDTVTLHKLIYISVNPIM